MIWIALYFSIALIDMACDGAICYATNRKYKIKLSFIACCFWPITAPMEIYAASILSKDFPDKVKEL